MGWDTLAACVVSLLVTVLTYWAGYSMGYRNARRVYLPSLVQTERDHARLIDDFSRLTGRKSDAVERERKWEAELREIGLEVPDERGT